MKLHRAVCASFGSAIAFVSCAGGAKFTPIAPMPPQPYVEPGSTLAKARSGIKIAPNPLVINVKQTASVTVSEKGYRGKFTATSACTGLASLSAASGKGPRWTLKATGLKPSSCTVVFVDSKKHQATLAVGVAVPFSVRQAALASVATQYAKLPHKDPFADATSIATFMKKLPQFVNVQVGYGGVFATFADGTGYTLFLDTPYGDSPATSAARPRVPPPSLRPSDAGTAQAYVLPNTSCAGTSGPPGYIDDIAAALSETGYATHVNPVDVAYMRSGAIERAKFLYVSSHGDVGEYAEGLYGFVLGTSTVVTDATDQLYKADRFDHSIIEGHCRYEDPRTGKLTLHEIYGVTSNFITKYVGFDQNSLAYLDTCLSASPDAGGWVNTILDQGATVYVGWSKEVHGNDAEATFPSFLDLTLGETQTALNVPQFNPPERPFGAYAVYDYITAPAQGLGISNYGDNVHYPPLSDGTTSRLEIFSKSGDAALAPSIQSVAVDEANHELEIGGIIPEGDLKIGLQSSTGSSFLSGVQRTPSGATAKIGLDSGYVTVYVDGVSSNPYPLSDLRGTITADAVGGGQSYNGALGTFKGNLAVQSTFSVHLRAALQPTRSDVGGPVVYPAYYASGGTNTSNVTEDSSANFTPSGTFSGTDDKGTMCSTAFSGSGTATQFAGEFDMWNHDATPGTAPINILEFLSIQGDEQFNVNGSVKQGAGATLPISDDPTGWCLQTYQGPSSVSLTVQATAAGPLQLPMDAQGNVINGTYPGSPLPNTPVAGITPIAASGQGTICDAYCTTWGAWNIQPTFSWTFTTMFPPSNTIAQ
jgi:hypothetical protein